MIRKEHGTILLVLSTDEAQTIVDGLDELLNTGRKLTTYKKIVEAVYLANYIEERLNEV